MWSYVAHRGAQKIVRELLIIAETDTDGLEQLLPMLPVTNWAQTLLRGNYAKAEAWMRHRGIPIDHPMATRFATRWQDLRASLITDLNTRYPFFEGAVFKKRSAGAVDRR